VAQRDQRLRRRAGHGRPCLDEALHARCGDHLHQRLQLVRQLTALALNCGVSGFGLDCGGNAGLEALFNDCNAACLSNTGVGDCIGEIDCFNNGGAIDPNTGFCGSSSFNCHEQPLGIPQGSANTPQECNAASKNRCTVILAGEANCTSDTQSCN